MYGVHQARTAVTVSQQSIDLQLQADIKSYIPINTSHSQAPGRKPPASARPAATTGKADTAPIHAHITNPSRKPSIDSLASTFRGRRQPSRALTDVASSHTEPPRAPTRSSTNVPEPRSSTDWRPRGGAVYESAHTSASSSLSSLADTIDSVHSSSSRENLPAESHSTSKTSDPLKKAPSPLEQEWSEVENDSSDEDDFVKSSGEGSVVGTEDKGNNNPGSASLHEAAVLVEDEQKQAHRLTEELSAATQKLENLSKERDALQQRLQRLEFENSQQVSHLKATLEATDAVSGAAAQAHATAMEERQQEIEKLQKSLAVLELMVEMRDEEIKALSQENGTLHKDVANRDDVIRKHEKSLRDSKKETDAAAVALWSYKARSEATLKAEKEERDQLKCQIGDLSNKLEELEMQNRERSEEVKRLRTSRKSVTEALLRSRSFVDEKDKALNDLIKQRDVLEKQREQCQEQLSALETEVEEIRNSGQRLIARTKEDQQLEITTCKNRIEALEQDISGYVSTILQLRSLLEAAEGTAEERVREINGLRTRIAVLEEDLDAKDKGLKDVSASCYSKEDTIRGFREELAELQAKDEIRITNLEETITALEDTIRSMDPTVEKLQGDILAQRQRHEARAREDETRISKLEKTVSSTRDKYRELRSRYEASEQSRRMLLDQLARRDEETRNPDSTFNFNLSSSIIRDPAQSNTDQVYTLLKNLNYEIFQIAALFADSLCTIERPSSSSSSPDTATTDLIDEESTSLLGPYLLSLVRSQSTIPLDTYDSYPLQAAIQATLVCCATRIMTAWYPGHWDLSDFLAATYTRIREAEGIPTSDTWKTTTRARLRPTTSTVLRVVDFLEECLNTLFKYAGWPTTGPSSSSSSSSSSSTTQTVDSLLKETREKLSALAKHCLRLNVLLDNVNPQLEPTLVEPGSIFDHHVMEREDVDIRSGRDDDREEVVATSEIGLRKVAEGSSGSGSSSSGRRRSVVKPKVILRSAFDA
ncbi:hypothetical protein Agabi119p4_2254 [Agaricus bisporus var. burnettii]|uniref:Uncharacterized protein n=1 Tax=Agaricus bisporus var. burnettii TaxID=192524 RepID=A0A8H7F8U6_AGABI|nr:hypothetical protein Agabi119p4_2254 [Agaricus bisporus var. burnettii]